ncbi:hypothetical protein BGW36DRAFT_433354 [Talaromyces proteolyticus]|uniref:Ecp2 effector protein domain-containing protein n=1 Tax=Talaromyces proteolyticus TaxID=1131652 RepID=A0AAD4KIV6_9EURO|nr:uncharacterized protein BGW36DRAFT_433354 [Talaromyces proteolyticus]KAH8689348.1 hypothetical protein BGW36DRAFT_433354 [Talaromyces proteolyticus]
MWAATVLFPFILLVTSALKLPGGLEDGVYRMYLDEHGNEIHESISTPALKEIAKASSAAQDISDNVETRSNEVEYVESFCGCGFDLVHSDCDAAVASLEAQLGTGVLITELSYYAIKGAVVAFVCNRGYGFEINSDDYARGIGGVTSVCGRYVAGSLEGYSFDDGGYADVGYMQYYAGLNFCEHAEGSGSSSC